ncbi:MAG: mechanosensitive ion channel family protein [Acidobacteriaceae bacterium]
MWIRRNFMRRLSACTGLLGIGMCLLLCFSAFSQMTAPNTGAQVTDHLNLVLRWSRQWTTTEFYLAVPGDEVYVESGKAIAQKVVKLEFQSALAQAALIGESSSKPGPVADNTENAINAQNVSRLLQSIGQQIQTLQTQLDTVNKKISTARPSQRSTLAMQKDTLQGQLQLAQVLQDNLRQLTSFMNSAENASGTATELTAKIMALQRTVPGVALPGAVIVAASAASKAASASATTTQTVQMPVVSNQRNEGLVGQMGQMFHLMGGMRSLDQLEDETARLQAATQQLRTPLLAALRATLQQGQIQLANVAGTSGTAASGNVANGSGNPADANSTLHEMTAPAASSAGTAPETSQQKQRQMKELVQHFKQLSDATLPLSQQLILVDQSRANLRQLKYSLQHEYTVILRSLLLRVATLLIALVLIWLFSELWRRGSLRYIRDARRRRQFLVVRRVVTGFFMVVVILLGFVSDFSSLATYAGLITAGIAVALQAVILSIAAYFFLVGRYGVRVGDRVTVVYNAANSVTGDVVDIGLVRFYLMELAGSDIDLKPTGRIGVFPNSVLFQTNPLFKQLPGTEYSWREIGLPLNRESDVELAEKELLALVDKAYAEYRPLLEKQHSNIEATVGLPIETPRPYARIRFINSGLEVVVCYPVPLRQASTFDDQMVMGVMDILRRNPSLRLADGAAPELRSVVKA